jgi:single-stranded-DNA-specific exonuclease
VAAVGEPGGILVERSLTGRLWRLAAERPELARAIGQQHGLPEIVARVLAARGLAAADIEGFVNPRLRDWLPDPSHLLDLDRAVERLVAAVVAREPVGLLGDYDVDGATATALVGRYLGALGVRTEIRVPDRLADGYGPNPAALASQRDAGCRLVLCLDSGTTAFAALESGRGIGLDVVVVDHHSAEPTLPPALAVVNPNRLDQQSPLGHLAAVGVAFVLLVGLARALRAAGHAPNGPLPDLLAMLDLVALGTVCDVVPLQGLNRAFVVQGLKVAEAGGNPGLRALALLAGVERIDDARKLGFMLGPRLNAGGRMGESGLGAALLGSDDPVELAEIARRLDRLNGERQGLERTTLEAALRAVEPQLKEEAPVLVAAAEGWHAGVVGIVAARLAERFARPAVVIGITGGVGKGSGRSRPGYDLGAAVIAARQAGILAAGGGHPMAAGLTVAAARVAALHAFLCAREAAPSFTPGLAELRVDGALTVQGVTLDLAGKLAQLAPFGAGHAEPRFVVEAPRVFQPRPVGRGHVACLLAPPAGPAVRGIAFRAADSGLDVPLLAGRPLRLAGRIRRDSWQGETRVQLEIEDAAPLA